MTSEKASSILVRLSLVSSATEAMSTHLHEGSGGGGRSSRRRCRGRRPPSRHYI